MQAVNFPLLLKQLQDKLYQKQYLDEFMGKVDILSILQKYQVGVKGTKRLVEKILQDNEHFKKILFVEGEKEIEIVLKLFQKEEFRICLADCIDSFYREVAEQLNILQENKIEIFNNQLSIFFGFINEELSEIALKVVKGLTKMLQKRIINCVQQDIFYEYLLKGMQLENDEARMRYMELSMEVSNYDQESHAKLIDSGILDICIQQIVTKDILLRLSACEVISKIGNRAYNSKYLAEHKLMNTIIFDAFNPLEELYVKKYLALLISKLIANKSLEFTLQLRQQFLDLVTQLFFQGFDEEKYAAIDIISQLSRTQDGIHLILMRKEVFTEYMKLSISTKANLKERFFNSFANFFSKEDCDKKSLKNLCNILICYGNVQKIDLILDFNQAAQSLDDMVPAIEKFFTILFQPFPEAELSVLYIVKELLEWKLFCRYLIGHAKALEYFSTHLAKTGEIYQLKEDLIKRLIHLCNNDYKNEHVTFKQFSDKLEVTIEEVKKNKIKANQKKIDEMEYATDKV